MQNVASPVGPGITFQMGGAKSEAHRLQTTLPKFGIIFMSESNIDQVLTEGSITELRSNFLNRDLSIEEAVKWFLSRIDSLNQSGKAINAVREVSIRAIDDAQTADRLLAKGRVCGPLHGIPMLLKDNILTADGMSSSAGAAALANFKSLREATIVRRLRQAGAIIIGKTNLTEFADYVVAARKSINTLCFNMLKLFRSMKMC